METRLRFEEVLLEEPELLSESLLLSELELEVLLYLFRRLLFCE